MCHRNHPPAAFSYPAPLLLTILVQRRHRQSMLTAKCPPRQTVGVELSCQQLRFSSAPPPAHQPSPYCLAHANSQQQVHETRQVRRFEGYEQFTDSYRAFLRSMCSYWAPGQDEYLSGETVHQWSVRQSFRREMSGQQAEVLKREAVLGELRVHDLAGRQERRRSRVAPSRADSFSSTHRRLCRASSGPGCVSSGRAPSAHSTLTVCARLWRSGRLAQSVPACFRCGAQSALLADSLARGFLWTQGRSHVVGHA